MLDLVTILLVLLVGAGMAWVGYGQAIHMRDTRAAITSAMDDVVKRQDDRIRKRVERSEPTEAGQGADTVRTGVDGIRAGMPIGRTNGNA